MPHLSLSSPFALFLARPALQHLAAATVATATRGLQTLVEKLNAEECEHANVT